MPPVSAWDKRYYRTGRSRGIELLLVKRCPEPRYTWTALTPALEVTTVNLRAFSAVSAEPKAGVRYTQMPVMTQVVRDQAMRSADQLIEGGIREAALGPYQEVNGFPGFVVGIFGVHGITGLLGRPFRSRRSFASTLGLLAFAYVGLTMSGVVDAVGMFAVGVWGWMQLT